MLAKMWKKVLLAICIIACIFNIMSKIVNRTSLESNLKNVKGESVFSILEQDEQNQESDEIDGVSSVETEENVVDSNIECTNEILENITSDYVVIY